jgi:4,5:9,10-diseco-3-hydroxy-5,9,17-trioxoandrosta-1(10),2-diene-4-oate hydrolase
MSITSSDSPTISPLLAAVGAWEPVGFYDAAGARVAVARRGTGIPLVCLHATGHGARDYEALAGRVGDRFDAIAVDWPGQGKSPREPHPASAARYAAIVEALLPQVSTGPAILLGCSIGGAAAIEVAIRRPDLVRALVLCDPGGLVEMGTMTRVAVRGMTRFFAAGSRGAWWFPRAFGLYYRLVLPRPAAAAQRTRIVAACRESAGVLAEAWTSFGEPSADLRPRLRGVACPTLFAWGREDRVLPWAASEQGARSICNHQVEFFQAGHAAFLEDPERFDTVLREFTASL